MDFVGGYGSDSDTENAVIVQPKPTPTSSTSKLSNQTQPKLKNQTQLKNVNSNNGSSQTAGQRKVKRLDISILPPEIQAALARGDSIRDSDDEDEPKINNVSNKPSEHNKTETKSKLLGMLPPPKSKEDIIIQPPSKVVSASEDSNTGVTTETSAPKSRFVFGFSSTETSRSSTSTANTKKPVEEDNVLPWMKNTEQNSLDENIALPFAVAAPPPHSIGAASNPLESSSSVSTAAYAAPAAPGPSYAQPAAVPQQTYEQYIQQQQHQQQYEDHSSVYMSNEPISQRKRKDRELELQLLAGDLSAVQQSGAVKDIAVDHHWNELRYTEQQQQQQEVQRSFGIGMNKALSQVSKQQNRKHQLSSLAIKAADTELAMLEKRGARNMTKSETQGKYGW